MSGPLSCTGAKQGGVGASPTQSGKILTPPLCPVRQVESTVAMQTLQPRIKEIQERYKGRPQDEMQAGRPRGGLGCCKQCARVSHRRPATCLP